MPLLKNGRLADDVWTASDDFDPVPDGATHVLFGADRLLAQAGEPEVGEGVALGVVWPNDRPVGELVGVLDRLALICLSFPTFKDGRAYSQARLLREQYGYRGEIRATGQVLRDQFVFMARAGFDALEVAKEADADAFAKELAAIPVVYQPGSDSRMTAFRARVSGR